MVYSCKLKSVKMVVRKICCKAVYNPGRTVAVIIPTLLSIHRLKATCSSYVKKRKKKKNEQKKLCTEKKDLILCKKIQISPCLLMQQYTLSCKHLVMYTKGAYLLLGKSGRRCSANKSAAALKPKTLQRGSTWQCFGFILSGRPYQTRGKKNGESFFLRTAKLTSLR